MQHVSQDLAEEQMGYSLMFRVELLSRYMKATTAKIVSDVFVDNDKSLVAGGITKLDAPDVDS